MRTAYKIIKDYYGDTVAERSKVPYINHINEGIKILISLKSSNTVIDAYCLHPILQSDEDFLNNKGFNFLDVSTESIILCMEYRRVANSYLSKNNKDECLPIICEEIREMLIADKVQNYKDFIEYHSISHPRKRELFDYFHNWFDILKLDAKNVNKLISII